MKLIHRRTFEFIRGYVASNGEAPTLKEIGEYVGLNSLGSVHEVVKKLEAQGLITRTPNVSRGIEIPQADFIAAGREG